MITVNGRADDERIKGEHDHGELLYAIDRIASPFPLSQMATKEQAKDASGTPLYHVDAEGKRVPTMVSKYPETLKAAKDNKTALLAAWEGSKDVKQVKDRGFGSTPELVRENKLRVDKKLKVCRKYMSLAGKMNWNKFVNAKAKEMVPDPDGEDREVPRGRGAAQRMYDEELDFAWAMNLETNPFWDQRHWPEWFTSLMSSSGDEAMQWLVDPANADKLHILCAWEPHRQMQLMDRMLPITTLMREIAAPTTLASSTDLRSYINDRAQGSTAEERESQKAARQRADYYKEIADRARESRALKSRHMSARDATVPVNRKRAREIEGDTLQYQRRDCGDTHQESVPFEGAASVEAPAPAFGKRKAEEAVEHESSDSEVDDPAIQRRRKARAARASAGIRVAA